MGDLTAPDLKIPPSTTTVAVRIIDTTSHLSQLPVHSFFAPAIQGFTELDCPCYSFLIEHPSGSKLLFDLGVRKDFTNLSPWAVEFMKHWKVEVKEGVREQLEEHGVKGSDIEAIIWSHWHLDHIGDPSTFESTTALIVGPGFKDTFFPGYPTNPVSPVHDSDWEGRELREISFEDNGGLKIGNFRAFDYFGDGSFYLVDSPGHAIGHISGLARVTSRPDSFIFMGGDACHHGGEFRPSKWLPLPSEISPNPLQKHGNMPCPGAVFESLCRDSDKTKPFFEIIKEKPPGQGIVYDAPEAMVTIGKVQEADAREEIFVVMSHDAYLKDVVDFFPKYANDFAKKGWVRDGRWAFLHDFRHAVKQ